MTKFRRMLGYLAIVSTIIGAGLLAYAFLIGPEASKQDNVVLIVTFSLWILPSLFAAVWFLTEKLIITNDKITLIRTIPKIYIFFFNTNTSSQYLSNYLFFY